MKAFVAAKAGTFLVIWSVLTVWMLLAAQPVQAHQYNTVAAPNCSGLPTADDFFGTGETGDITSTTPTATPTPKQGLGSATANSGNTNYHYAQITIPAIAAGELRVFDASGATVSAAALCRRGTRISFFTKSYSSSVHTAATHDDPTDPLQAHETFQIRAQVSPGDETYIVVIDPADPTASPAAINVAFHGVIYRAGSNDTLTDEFTQRGQQYDYELTVTADGLLTVQTTGSTDTKGQLNKDSVTTGPIATDESGGSSGNFKLVVPVVSGTDYTVIVDQQTLDTRGTYTLDLDFEVAMATITWADFITARMLDLSSTASGGSGYSRPAWGPSEATAFPADDDMLKLESGDEDYFFFTSTTYDSLTIETKKPDGEDRITDTTGTLYGPTGELASDTSSGEGTNFLIDAPVGLGSYVVKVTGATGPYVLSLFSEEANKIAEVPSVSSMEDDGATDLTIAAPAEGAPLNSYYHVLDIKNAGALYVHTTGNTDTAGILYGPDGRELDDDDDSGPGMNFRLAANVQPGLHLVLVQGKERTTAGPYSLVVNLVEGAEVGPPSGGGGSRDTAPDPDPTGHLDEPPSGGIRSGVGIIRGWVCQDDGNGVQIRILNTDGRRVTTITAPWGSSRRDVPVADRCDEQRTTNVGFAVQFNYNTLAEGTYRAEAWVDGEQVGGATGQTNTFRVIRISNEEFLQRVRSDRIPVEDFPRQGDTTILEWDQASQNFQIVDHE